MKEGAVTVQQTPDLLTPKKFWSVFDKSEFKQVPFKKPTFAHTQMQHALYTYTAVHQASQLRASRGDPASSGPSRIPPRFGRGGTRSSPPSNKIHGMEFDGSSSVGSGRRDPLSSSTPRSQARNTVSDAALDDFGGSGKAPLQERLQAAPVYLREKAVDLREDARDRVHDIRVSRTRFIKCLVVVA